MRRFGGFPNMVDFVPEGEKGEAKVRHVSCSAQDSAWTAVRALASGNAGEVVREGSYAQLLVNGHLVMSDTQMERRSNYGVVLNAEGDVLIAGLGLGMILLPVLAKEEVKSVTVIELSQDVIDLVEPHIRKASMCADKLTVIQGDIFEWKPPKGQKWDCIYFDIWADICTDSLDDMAKLHRKFGRRKNSGAWMDSWKKSELKLQRDRDRRQERAWGRFW